MIYGAYDQLWTVNVVHIAPGFFRTNFYVLQGCVVVFWRHTIIEHDTIGDFACQLHHTHLRCTNVDGHVARLEAAVDDVEFNIVYVMKLAMEGDALHIEQPPHDFNGLTHGLQRLFTFNAHLFSHRIPPGTQSADHTICPKVV